MARELAILLFTRNAAIEDIGKSDNFSFAGSYTFELNIDLERLSLAK